MHESQDKVCAPCLPGIGYPFRSSLEKLIKATHATTRHRTHLMWLSKTEASYGRINVPAACMWTAYAPPPALSAQSRQSDNSDSQTQPGFSPPPQPRRSLCRLVTICRSSLASQVTISWTSSHRAQGPCVTVGRFCVMGRPSWPGQRSPIINNLLGSYLVSLSTVLP